MSLNKAIEHNKEYRKQSINTMDLISRQAAIEKFESWLKVDGYSEGELNMLKAVLYELRFLPSAEPERKKGKWIEYNATGKKQWMCSECCAEEKNPKVARFCYWCGVDMRGKQNE